MDNGILNIEIKYDTGKITDGVKPSALVKYIYSLIKTVGGVIEIRWKENTTEEEFYNDLACIREAMFNWKYAPIKIAKPEGMESSGPEYFHIPTEGNSTIIVVPSISERATFISAGSLPDAVAQMTDKDVENNEYFCDFCCLRGNPFYDVRAKQYDDYHEKLIQEIREYRDRGEEHWAVKIRCARALGFSLPMTKEEIENCWNQVTKP